MSDSRQPDVPNAVAEEDYKCSWSLLLDSLFSIIVPLFLSGLLVLAILFDAISLNSTYAKLGALLIGGYRCLWKCGNRLKDLWVRKPKTQIAKDARVGETKNKTKKKTVRFEEPVLSGDQPTHENKAATSTSSTLLNQQNQIIAELKQTIDT
jgi:hypothetical protein